jgi:hypothetical protein
MLANQRPTDLNLNKRSLIDYQHREKPRSKVKEFSQRTGATVLREELVRGDEKWRKLSNKTKLSVKVLLSLGSSRLQPLISQMRMFQDLTKYA